MSILPSCGCCITGGPGRLAGEMLPIAEVLALTNRPRSRCYMRLACAAILALEGLGQLHVVLLLEDVEEVLPVDRAAVSLDLQADLSGVGGLELVEDDTTQS